MAPALPRPGRAGWLAIAGGTSFIVFVVTGAPAALLGRPLGAAGVAAGGFRGTVWQGEADGVVAGGLRVDQLRWRLAPLGLLGGRLRADIEASLPDAGFATGSVSLAPGGLRLEDFTAAAPLAALGPMAGALGPTGEVRFKVERFEWRDGWVATAIGTAEVAGIDATFGAVPGAPPATGTFIARFDAPAVAPGEPLTAAVTDGGGPLELAATLTLTPPSGYTLTGSAKARPGAPPALANGLRMLGPDDGQGGHQLTLAGSF